MEINPISDTDHGGRNFRLFTIFPRKGRLVSALGYGDCFTIRASKPFLEDQFFCWVVIGRGSKNIGAPIGSANATAIITVIAKSVSESEENSISDLRHRAEIGAANIDRFHVGGRIDSRSKH